MNTPEPKSFHNPCPYGNDDCPQCKSEIKMIETLQRKTTPEPKKCPGCGGLPGLYENNLCPTCYVIKTTPEPISNIDEIFNASPIDEEVPDDVWGTIYPTWTGLWTDAHGKWDEKQPSDIYPLSDLLSDDAEQRLKQAITRLITEARKDQIMQDFNQVSLDTTIDEAIINSIRDNQLAELEATLNKENK